MGYDPVNDARWLHGEIHCALWWSFSFLLSGVLTGEWVGDPLCVVVVFFFPSLWCLDWGLSGWLGGGLGLVGPSCVAGQAVDNY